MVPGLPLVEIFTMCSPGVCVVNFSLTISNKIATIVPYKENKEQGKQCRLCICSEDKPCCRTANIISVKWLFSPFHHCYHYCHGSPNKSMMLTFIQVHPRLYFWYQTKDDSQEVETKWKNRRLIFFQEESQNLPFITCLCSCRRC